MPLKAKIANKSQTNEQGLTEGTITSVLEIPKRYKNSKNEPITEEMYAELKKQGKKPLKFEPQFEFLIESEGSQKNIVYHFWTYQNFNNEKYERENKTTDYNDFTRLMLQLEMINESDLKDLSNPKLADLDVDGVEGLKITFELQPSKKGNGLKEPKLTSIKLLQLAKK